MKRFALLFVLLVGPATAGDFASRLAAGNKAAATTAGKPYDKLLGPIIQAAMLSCAPPGSSGHLGNFALVGTISASGKLSSVEVLPPTATSGCFAEQIKHSTFAPPPSAPYPLAIEMTVSP
jgi:hypothetical protein